MQKNPWDRELSKVFDFLKIALRTGVFLVFHINIFKNDIFVNFSLIWVRSKTFMEKLFLEI
jgi:hypothetical protein